MDTDLYTQIVDECFEISESINFSFFGEPSLHPFFIFMMDYLKNRPPGMKVVMNTNMSTFMWESKLSKIIEIGLDNLRISLDAATSDTFYKTRPHRDGELCYIDIETNVLRWLAKKNHVPTRIVFTESSLNKHETKMFVKKWRPHLEHKDTILVKRVLTYGGKISDPMIKPHPCNVWGSRFFTVDWRGYVSPCNLDTNMDLVIGNVTEERLEDIVFNERFQNLKKLSLEKLITPCKNCIDSNNLSFNKIYRN